MEYQRCSLYPAVSVVLSLLRDFFQAKYQLSHPIVMAKIVLIEPTELYNILNQETVYPCLSDQNFLLLLGKINPLCILKSFFC